MFRSYGAVALGSTCSIDISPLRGEEQSEHGIDDHLIRASCNSLELRSMDSTLPHLKDSVELLLDS